MSASMNKIVTGWKPQHSKLWSKHTVTIEHNLHKSELFSEDALAALIDRTPADYYKLGTVDEGDPQTAIWREGLLDNVSGKKAIETIKKGRFWLNIHSCQDFDPRYKAVLDQLFEEFEAQVPGLKTYKRNMGVLITSPKCQTLYHMDVPGQHLWQIAGRKKVYIYPNREPFLTNADRQRVIMKESREEYPFEPWYDDYAEVYNLEPGQMAYWPLHAPHRVVNEDCLNISLTLEHWDKNVRNTNAVQYGNGVLKRLFGYEAKNNEPKGFHVYPKAALAMAYKKLGFEESAAFKDKVDFKLDPSLPEGLVDIPQTFKVV